jgi:hypothetical protein
MDGPSLHRAGSQRSKRKTASSGHSSGKAPSSSISASAQIINRLGITAPMTSRLTRTPRRRGQVHAKTRSINVGLNDKCVSLFDAPPSFRLARTLADRLSRPVGCSAATLAPWFQAGRYGPPVLSSILEARAELTLDKTFPLDNKSLFDTVPLLTPF